VNSLFVGESDNKGTPKTEAEIKYGRTMPRKDADYPIRGYEYYDFTHHVINTKFVNFVDNATRKTGAISYLLYTSFPISTNNDVEGLKFENAKPVYFPPQQDRRWSFSGEFGRFSGWNGAVFHDIDGSAGGVRDSYIVIDNGIADDPEHCQIKPDWNAAVCKGDMGRVQIGAGGAGGRGGPGAPGAHCSSAGSGAFAPAALALPEGRAKRR
jgi:cell migration-inducing and hyaluronan-binding protein